MQFIFMNLLLSLLREKIDIISFIHDSIAGSVKVRYHSSPHQGLIPQRTDQHTPMRWEFIRRYHHRYLVRFGGTHPNEVY